MHREFVARVIPRNRRFHEGKLYNVKIDDYLKRFKRKEKVHNFFKDQEANEDTEHTKHFVFNDMEGFYDLRNWDGVDWNLVKEDLEQLTTDSSMLTQNYILATENSKLDKWASLFLHLFVITIIGFPMAYILLKAKMSMIWIGLAVSAFIFSIYLFLTYLGKKRKFTKEEYLSKMAEVCEFYNNRCFSQQQARVSYGGEGGYLLLTKFDQKPIVLPNQQFYQYQGVAFNPYQDILVEEEPVKVEKKKNWRDQRQDNKKEMKKNGYQYSGATQRSPGFQNLNDTQNQSDNL